MSDGVLPSATATSMFAVLVIYRQSLEESATFQSLSAVVRELPQPLTLLVYDNSPSPVGRPGAGPYPGWDIQYVHDPTNPGISQAYLTGALMASDRSKRWLLLLDQDTRFPPEALDRYLSAIAHHPGVSLFAPVLTSGGRVISPCRYRFKLGFRLTRVEPGPQPLADLSVLNSGMCIAVAEYLAVGGHDVRIALDFADHEFIERFKECHHTFVVVNTVCGHDFFRVTAQSTASHLARFRFYCSGARQASKGLMDDILTAGIIGARACLLSVRHGSLKFLRIAVGALLGGDSR
jgi:glycosyltransferase involved in cell wall biosynthesis